MVVKLRRIRWAGHVYKGDEKFILNYSHNLKGRDHLEEGKVILNWILKK
jgi:hypothetical protein